MTIKATLKRVLQAYIGDTNFYVYSVGGERCVIEMGHYQSVPYQVAVVADLEAAKSWIAHRPETGKRGIW